MLFVSRVHLASGNICFGIFIFLNLTPPTESYTLSLHDALPIWRDRRGPHPYRGRRRQRRREPGRGSSAACQVPAGAVRSEEHTSELQSQFHLVCRLLLEKKKISTNRSPCTNTTISNKQAA